MISKRWISRRGNNRRTRRAKVLFPVFTCTRAMLLLSAGVMLFSGCAGIMPGTEEGTSQSGAGNSGEAEKRQDAQVTVPEVESALMQLTIQMNAVSEFEDYSRGAAEFEEPLAMLFLLDRGPDPEEHGVLRAVYKETGEVYHEFTRALVDIEDAEFTDPEKEDTQTAAAEATDPQTADNKAADAEAAENFRLWRFVHTVEGESFSFEVLVDSNRIPREVWYEDPYTGEKLQRATRFDEIIKRAEDPASRAEVLRSIERQKREEVRSELPAYYRELEIIGKESIEQAGKTLEAVHLSRKLGAAFGGDLYVWYSREIPGGIIRVRIGEDIPKVGVEKWKFEL